MDEKAVANIVDDIERVVSDRVDDGGERLGGRRKVAEVDGIAFLALATIGDGQDQEPFVFSDLDRVEALGIRRVGEDQLIGGLRRADAVIEHLMIDVLLGKVFARVARGVATVEEPIAGPCRTRHLDPLDHVGERLLRRHIEHSVLEPVRSPFGKTIDRTPAVVRHREDAQLRGAVW
jgi:hypothetical protein